MAQSPFPSNTELTFVPGDYAQSSKGGITFTAKVPTNVTAKPPAVPPKPHPFSLKKGDTIAISSDGSITITQETGGAKKS